jgi:hypothetical protein
MFPNGFFLGYQQHQPVKNCPHHQNLILTSNPDDGEGADP